MHEMDEVRYMCFCRSIFPTLNALELHFACCEQFKSTTKPIAGPDATVLGSRSPERGQELKVQSRHDITLKIMKSWAVVMDDEQHRDKPEKLATNLWGRRLPRRTKVPYLSRAVSLSIDHSYERCQCGAVFVTRMGKRQHQARFCKFVKKKSKKPMVCEGIDKGNEKGFLGGLTPAESEFMTQDGYLLTTADHDPAIIVGNQHTLFQFQKLL